MGKKIGEFLGFPIVLSDSVGPSGGGDIVFSDIPKVRKKLMHPIVRKGECLVQELTQDEYEIFKAAGFFE